MRSLRLALALTCAAALAVGCGDDAPTAAPAQPSPSASPAPSAAASPDTTTEPSEVPPVAAPGSTVSFMTPTGNIRCGMAGQSAVCEIKEREYEPPAKPADCDLDHGNVVAVGREGPALFLCYGDTSFGIPTPVLAYGRSTTNGVFRCSTSKTGVICEASRGEHGFELSRGSYRLF